MDDSILRGVLLRGVGERLNGIQEVSGSIPLISTKWFVKRTAKSLENTTFSRLFPFRGTFYFRLAELF